MIYLGDFLAGQTVYIPFHTFAAAGNSVTITGLSVTDIEIYKNGSVTQRASDNGYTLLDTDGIDFDGLTGIHGFSVDLSDNSDSGFYAAGNDYMVVVSAITVDSQTVSFVAALFSIQNRCVNWAKVGAPTTTVGLSGTTVKAVTDAVTTGTISANAVSASALATDAVAEIVDALIAKVPAELTSIPAAGSTTVGNILAMIAMAILSPNTATATARALKKRDGTSVGTATRSDNGTTYSQGEMS